MKSQLYADIVNKLALDLKSKMDSTKLDIIKEEIESANSSQREEEKVDEIEIAIQDVENKLGQGIKKKMIKTQSIAE